MRKIIIILFVGVLVFDVAPIDRAQAFDLTSLQSRISELNQKLTELQNRSFNTPNIAPTTLWTRITKKPMRLKVGEQGEWRVKTLRLASSTPYTLQVSWGQDPVDEIMKLPASSKTNRMVFFHNKYTKPGNYSIKFIGKQGNRTSIAETTIVVTP